MAARPEWVYTSIMTYHISNTQAYVLAALAVWELVWKGLALWKAAKNRDTAWFVVILVVNSAGILPIIYLLLNRGEPETQA